MHLALLLSIIRDKIDYLTYINTDDDIFLRTISHNTNMRVLLFRGVQQVECTGRQTPIPDAARVSGSYAVVAREFLGHGEI